MESLSQSPTDPAFVADPYPFYARARAAGAIVRWADYDLPVATGFAAVSAILRDRRLGRETPPEVAAPVPPHLRAFYAVEAHSMLELEPPAHSRLRGLVLRAFTSRRIAALAPEIAHIASALIARFPEGPFDLLDAFARPLPVLVIARLLGVPEERASDLLAWSNAMVGMYQARRDRAAEDAAERATLAFRAALEEWIAARRRALGDDLVSELVAARDAGDRLSHDELVSTVILLLNAGHEATVHTIGNGVRLLLEHAAEGADLAPLLAEDSVAATVEEILRYDPPLHLFTRWVYEPVTLFGHAFARGDRIGCLLASANRDPAAFEAPEVFDPARPIRPNASFGAGIHFCVGAPLGRLELAVALPLLFARCPRLQLTEEPRVANVYHFRGLERLPVRCPWKGGDGLGEP